MMLTSCVQVDQATTDRHIPKWRVSRGELRRILAQSARAPSHRKIVCTRTAANHRLADGDVPAADALLTAGAE